MPHHALDERHALAQTLRQTRPDAPTLCGDWSAAQLAAHLVLRERSVLEAAGRFPVPSWQRRAADVVEDAARETPYAELVELVDAGPSWREVRGPVPTAWLWSLPPVRETANLLEYVVHHEDVRRAVPGWEPRPLDPTMQGAVWGRLRMMAPLLLRRMPLGVELVAPELGSVRTRRAKRNGTAVTIVGPPVELAMAVFGRIPQSAAQWRGAPEDVAAARRSDLSF